MKEEQKSYLRCYLSCVKICKHTFCVAIDTKQKNRKLFSRIVLVTNPIVKIFYLSQQQQIFMICILKYENV